MTDLYKIYAESTNKPVSYSTFCLLKPVYVGNPEFTERDTCLCKVCENARLLVRSLYNAKALSAPSMDCVISYLCCPKKTEECLLRTCLDCQNNSIPFLECDLNKRVKIEEWQTIQENRCDSEGKVLKVVKRTVEKERFQKIGEIKDLLLKFVEKIMSHVFRFRHQFRVVKEFKGNMTPSDILFHVDFPENYQG